MPSVALIVPPATVMVPALLMPFAASVDVRLPVAMPIEAPLTRVMPPLVVSVPVPPMLIVAPDPDRSTVVALGVVAVTVSVAPDAIESVSSPGVAVPVIVRVLMVVLAVRVG